MPKHEVMIIGGGPAGYGAALYAASAGLEVGLVEMGVLGGTCLNVGCVPAKELLETAAVYKAVGHASDFGISAGEPTIDMVAAQERKQGIVDQLTGGVGVLLNNRKVTVYDGVGKLGPGRTVSVSGGESGDVEITADKVILAAGSKPRTIPGFDIDGKLVMTSDEFLSVDYVPASAAIIGGGAIGCEFASTLSDLGSKVTVLEALPRIIPGADEDVVKIVQRSFKKRGIDVHADVMVTGHKPNGSGTTVSFGDGQTVDVEVVVVSVGRRPYSESLGLEGTGVVVDERGFIVVDEYCRTGEAGVYAAGDVIPTAALAHVAWAEGILIVGDILGEDPVPVDYQNVPWCIYCQPEVAFAGLTEEDAKDAGFDVVTAKHRFIANSRAKIIGETEGLVKIVAEKAADGSAGRILGVHMVGPWVTEQLGQGYLAVNWEATVDEVAHFIQPHPTLSELFGETVLSMTGRSLH